jgi:hypothetical protein
MLNGALLSQVLTIMPILQELKIREKKLTADLNPINLYTTISKFESILRHA